MRLIRTLQTTGTYDHATTSKARSGINW
jgi:hypothetical protein